jgi:hypothetical protein
MPEQQRHLAFKLLGLCALGLLLASTGAQAQSQSQSLQLPALKHAEQTTLMQEAQVQYQRYAAAPDTFFSTGDAKKTEWPCKVSAAQLDELTGISNYKSGSEASGYGHSYSDVSVHPVTARCKAGKLDGQVELVYEAVRKAWGPGYQNNDQESGRVVATISGGKLVHRLELRKSTDLAKDNVGSQPKSTSVASSAEKPDGDFINSATILVNGEGQKYFLKRPVKTPRGTRLEKTFYNGTTLVSVEQTDASGKPDGMAVSYKGGEEKKSCFKQGKPANLKTCGS